MISRRLSLAARPLRTVEQELIETPDGGRLKIPLRQRKWAAWMFRLPEGSTKTFELDAMGVFVWNHCDGKTTVRQIIQALAKRYRLNLREAEVPTAQFLQMLLKKGLLGMDVPGEKDDNIQSD